MIDTGVVIAVLKYVNLCVCSRLTYLCTMNSDLGRMSLLWTEHVLSWTKFIGKIFFHV